MTQLKKLIPLAIGIAAGMAASSAQAQNPNYTPGDLIMGFQLRAGTGSNQTVLVALPDTATFFRDGTGVQLNIASVGSLLDSTFGLTAGNSLAWFENPDLYFGLVGAWSNANPSSSLQNLDPERTIYVSKSRTAVGTDFTPSSTIANVTTNTNMTNAANQIISLQQTLELGSMTDTLVKPTADANTWENFNLFSGANQGTAFTAFTGGIQQRFTAGTFGTFSFGVGAVEGALDLYRFQAANDVTGQFGEGDPIRVGSFQGTITIDSSGDISAMFSPIPEPSMALLVGGGMLGVFSRRRRS